MEKPENDGYKQRIQQNSQNSPDPCRIPYPPGCQCIPDEESQPGIPEHPSFLCVAKILLNKKQRHKCNKYQGTEPPLGPGQREQ